MSLWTVALWACAVGTVGANSDDFAGGGFRNLEGTGGCGAAALMMRPVPDGSSERSRWLVVAALAVALGMQTQSRLRFSGSTTTQFSRPWI